MEEGYREGFYGPEGTTGAFPEESGGEIFVSSASSSQPGPAGTVGTPSHILAVIKGPSTGPQVLRNLSRVSSSLQVVCGVKSGGDESESALDLETEGRLGERMHGLFFKAGPLVLGLLLVFPSALCY